MRYNPLINGLEGLRAFADPDAIIDTNDVLSIVRDLADDFEFCIPATGEYFERLWRRSPKARSLGDWVEYIARIPT